MVGGEKNVEENFFSFSITQSEEMFSSHLAAAKKN
jgi:hypothetical protein